MTQTALPDAGLAELTSKIDALTMQVAYLTEQAQAAERGRQERAELMSDLTPIANDAFRIAVRELEEVQSYVDLGDLLRLLKRLARNGPNIELLLDQMESLMDMTATVGPLADEAFGKAVDLLQQAEHKGYFAFAREGMQIADNVITSFTEEDVRALGDNIVLILRTVQQMTQPEIMNLLGNTVASLDAGPLEPAEYSYRALVSQLRDPEVRRGMAVALRMLHNIGAQSAPTG
jgi:uncharacterized protein YjgD (DUF1641 family)